ncbi:hypothetical protein [Streptomyces phaeochromogenes]|uniref:hypothetical protein n=1 Tax=Streptomyces phaeochromogenes TaxID=1923 RepID=UPI003592F96D
MTVPRSALYGLTLLVGLRASRRRGVRAGHVHRAAAECVASMTWLYAAGADPSTPVSPTPTDCSPSSLRNTSGTAQSGLGRPAHLHRRPWQ